MHIRMTAMTKRQKVKQRKEKVGFHLGQEVSRVADCVVISPDLGNQELYVITKPCKGGVIE